MSAEALTIEIELENAESRDLELTSLYGGLRRVEQRVGAAAADFAHVVAALPSHRRASAANLIDYLALRSLDLRELQNDLTRNGLSSLGRAEMHVRATLHAATGILARALGASGVPVRAAVSPDRAWALLQGNAEKLLGPVQRNRDVRVMVTMPTEAASSVEFVRDLLLAGMDCMRINCAHDDPESWERMIRNLRSAQAATGRPCRLLMDLPGPKVRTGTLAPEALTDDAVGAAPGSSPPPRKPGLMLHEGDTLILTSDDEPGRPARLNPLTEEVTPARIACKPAGILDRVRPGERIWFDDGRIAGLIRKVGREVEVEITGTRPGGDKLKPEKGVNLPDSHLAVSALTESDLEILPFIARHADIVGYSFVATPEDVRQLYSALALHDRPDIGIVLKIERSQAFANLPALLLEGMKSNLFGVMIARGDLAVECGFARLAEVQEEILWLCAAAHVPVIWATQVMEQLTKYGRPSRSEVSDAAMGARAECIMLNKGPHVVDAVRAVNSITGRMHDHQQKKRAILSRLSIAEGFIGAGSWHLPA